MGSCVSNGQYVLKSFLEILRYPAKLKEKMDLQPRSSRQQTGVSQESSGSVRGFKLCCGLGFKEYLTVTWIKRAMQLTSNDCSRLAREYCCALKGTDREFLMAGGFSFEVACVLRGAC